jgi:hypothetical protein
MGGRARIESYMRDKVPLGYWGTVDEIAEAILLLVSDWSSYIRARSSSSRAAKPMCVHFTLPTNGSGNGTGPIVVLMLL